MDVLKVGTELLRKLEADEFAYAGGEQDNGECWCLSGWVLPAPAKYLTHDAVLPNRRE
jgi:hypothetical protein